MSSPAMQRLDVETEIMTMMGQVDLSGNIIASPFLRTYVQNKIQAALDAVWTEFKYAFRRKEFGALLKAPATTGTLAVTQYSSLATFSTLTPDDSFIGCHLVIPGQLYPLRINSYSGKQITLNSPYVGATDPATAFTLYFDTVAVPDDCQEIQQNTIVLAGHRRLTFLRREDFQRRQGYWGYNGDDYGFWGGSVSSAVIQGPVIGQPNVYTSWGNLVSKSTKNLMRLMSFYPFPANAFPVEFDGWSKPPLLTQDDSIPAMPEQFHRGLWLIRSKLDMCEFPGFELSATEQRSLQATYQMNKVNFQVSQSQDNSEFGKWGPTKSMC